MGQPVGGTDAARRVHAHVQRTIVHEAEAARGVIELRRRHAEVGQQSGHAAGQTQRLDVRGQGREGVMDDTEAGIGRRQRLAGGDGFGILVESDQARLGRQAGEQLARMTAAPEGGVHVAALAIA